MATLKILCFKRFMEKEPLALVFGSVCLETRIVLKKSLKNIFNCYKLQIVLKNKTR